MFDKIIKSLQFFQIVTYMFFTFSLFYNIAGILIFIIKVRINSLNIVDKSDTNKNSQIFYIL